MEITELMKSIFTDHTLRTVSSGSAILGVIAGSLGSFAVLRKQSLLGDAISHAALPGIGLAFLLTRSKMPLVLILGAAFAGWIATLFVMSIVKNTRIKNETALGLVLSVFFGFGLVLLTFIQKIPDASQAGLDKFLFGQAATLLTKDVMTMAVLGLLTLIMLIIFWKEFKIFTFDLNYAASLGMPTRAIDILLTSLLVVAIVLGIQTVGVVLMSALVVAPGVAARQWTDKLGLMVFLAGIFGALSGIVGAVLSSYIPQLPTGPTIVLCVSGLVFISLFLAPNRGLIWKWTREQHNRKRLELEAILSDLFILAEQHQSIDHGHGIEVLRTMSLGHGGVDASLKELEKQKLVRQVEPGKWALTSSGLEDVKRFHQTREKES